MLFDFHMHSALYPGDDGAAEMTPDAIAARWSTAGCSAIGLTPHFHAGLDQKAMLRQLQQVREKISHTMDCFIGCEAELLAPDGRLSVSNEIAAELDYVIVSADHYNCEGVLKSPELAELHWKTLCRLASDPLTDVIAHPFAALILLTCEGYLPGLAAIEELPLPAEEDIRSFARLARQHGTAVEVNGFFVGSYLRKRAAAGHSYEESYRYFYRILAEENVVLSPNSDAHRLSDTDQLREAFQWCDSLGIPREQLFFPKKK